MLINNLISFNHIIIVWLIMYFFIVLLNYRDILIKKKYGNVEDIKKSSMLAQRYLDQFYVTNKFYTFFISFIYIFCMVLIFIIIRYFYINDITQIIPQNNLYEPLLRLILGYIILAVTLLLYKSLLIILFKKEINKLCIYLAQFFWLFKIKKLLEFSLSNYIIKYLYLITYRLGTLTYKYPYFPRSDNIQDWHEANIKYLFDDEVDYEIDNKIFISYMYYVQNIIIKYIFIQKAFIFFAYIFRFLLKYIHNLYQPFPYFFFICVFLVELYNKEFIYIYLATFIIIIIKTKRDLYIFLNNRNDYHISNYFYKNSNNYQEQRVYICNEDNVNIIPSFNSYENKVLLGDLNQVIEYTYNKNFVQDLSSIPNRIRGIYRRFWIIVGFLLIIYYLLFYMNILYKYSYLLLLPIVFMILTHYYTYYRPLTLNNEENIDYAHWDYAYNKKYIIIFWIFTVIQGYIYWLLLLKPSLIFMNTEILLEVPYNLLKITKTYTTDEKIMYLFQYFEYYINTMDIDKEYVRHIIRLIDYHDFIDEKIMLKDIQVYIKLLIDNYIYNEYFQEKVKEIMVEIYIPEKIKENSWYTLLKNILIISAITSTLLNINNLWLIVKKINSPKDVYIIVKYMYIKTVENKLTYETFMNYIVKIFKW